MALQYAGPDQAAVVSFSLAGRRVYNPFEVALQAMIGQCALDAYQTGTAELVPRYVPSRLLADPRTDPLCRAAMDWLIVHEVRITDAASLWHYDFDWCYGGAEMRAPWPSAFAQAYVVQACLLWHRHSGDATHLARAERAARALSLPIAEGGVCFAATGDACFFEEIPAASPTHIFNAHLVALLALRELASTSAETSFAEAYARGVRGFARYSGAMVADGYSAYDMSLRPGGLALQLLPHREGVALTYVELPGGTSSDAAPAIFDLCADEIFEPGPLQLAGIDWAPCEDRHGTRMRPLLYGPERHPEPVAGGTRQNTYLYVQQFGSGAGRLRLRGFAAQPTRFGAAIRSADGSWPQAQQREIELPAGSFDVALDLPSAPRPRLSQVYHRFHILLLEELAAGDTNPLFADLTRDFSAAELRLVRARDLAARPSAQLDTVYFSVNAVCGLSCKMCDFGIENRNASLFKALQPEDATQRLDDALIVRRCQEALPELRTVHFIGTEPLMYPPIARVAAELKAMGIRVMVTTNGLLLHKHLASLCEAGVDELWISLDGDGPTHDAIRGREGLFDHIADTLRAQRDVVRSWQQRGGRLCVSCAISPLNIGRLAALVESTRDLGFGHYHFTHLNYVTDAIASGHRQAHPEYPIYASTLVEQTMRCESVDAFALYSDLLAARRLCHERSVSFQAVPDLDLLGMQHHYHAPQRPTGAGDCHVPWRCLEVSANGDVAVMSRCYQFTIGNIHDRSLPALFKGEAMNRFRAFLSGETLPAACYRCCGVMQ